MCVCVMADELLPGVLIVSIAPNACISNTLYMLTCTIMALYVHSHYLCEQRN